MHATMIKGVFDLQVRARLSGSLARIKGSIVVAAELLNRWTKRNRSTTNPDHVYKYFDII